MSALVGRSFRLPTDVLATIDRCPMTSKKTVLHACGSGAVVSGASDWGAALTGYTYDSRQVVAGSVFVAVSGLWVDGHDYVDQALAAGATLVIAESEPPASLNADVTWVQVKDSAQVLGEAADAFYGSPSSRMTAFAVTGTNGKTTVTSMIWEVLDVLGVRPGLVGTVEHRFGEVRRKTIFTTPPSADLHALLAEMQDAAVTHVALEASSHGLSQHRLAGARLDVAGFTNLTQDHLDYHQSMDAYFDAKARLFRELVERAVFNVDDPAGRRLADEMVAAGGRILTFSVNGADADLRATDITCRIDGARATVVSPWGGLDLRLDLVGAHNVANALTTLGMLTLAEFDPHAVVAALRHVKGAAGRLEVVPGARHVLVDYAHTPDALDNVCSALRPLTEGRLIVVFGAGGDRDPGKRPQMGATVQRWADVALVTSDNPRTEAPGSIVEDILAGMTPGPQVVVELDRRAAIEAGIRLADGPGDVVLIAGKGHEDYQVLGADRVHFDDREEAARVLAGVS